MQSSFAMCSHFSQSVSRVWKPGAVSWLLEHMSHTDVACHGNVSGASSLRSPGVLFFDRPIWRTRNWQFPAIRRQPRRVSAERSRKQGLLLRTSLTLTGHTSPVSRVCGGSCVWGQSISQTFSLCKSNLRKRPSGVHYPRPCCISANVCHHPLCKILE